ncbi:glycosyl transferase [Snodgrassella alvi]|uniref:glycosyltransferase family 2 protein n=1 Tax=Snodgrassella alvi TaxID=1196083 RepID=UPI0009FE8DF0|nr:glycosyltransferase family 2 protein [Snodgrassella alvi]ORF00949.1 glycosyl transferase [Snodgrassella alvi]ORF01127.1 glycosyl transferase [Snodgrassella alvi]ORF07860.1 glycosyl transferase [Snodgrassella alvi]ORF12100.1 glycosyl transferase [Snodgrassella alvi]ORF12992.1 glycosyl transferase [Snodgrassella alvi]
MRLLALIPHYNHLHTVGKVAQSMLGYGIDCLIVDDGSDETIRTQLRELLQPGIEIIYRACNGGKGAAVKDGIKYAAVHGYTHILQVDADAQHCLEDTQKLITAAEAQPHAVICGRPVYNDDTPKARLYGRKITNFWLAINTLSMDIQDGMCGFRIYPLVPTIDVIREKNIGNYMDFDAELLVYLHRRGCVFIWIDTPITYASDGISHFRVWKDNVLISRMHARLFFNMLLNLPEILRNRRKRKLHG